MKNLKKIKILPILLSLLILAQNVIGQSYRSVHWLHGFNGDISHWRGYANRFGGVFGERQMTSYRPIFETTGNVNLITDNVKAQIDPALTNNIGIGHSLGGIVFRNMEAGGGGHIDGIITVHSPNKGASIAKSIKDGDAEDFLNYVSSLFVSAVNGIEDHLATEMDFLNGLFSIINVVAYPFTWIFAGNDVLLENAEAPEQETVEETIEDAFDLLADPTLAGVISDFDPTGAFINDLNAFPSTLPRIEVHGYEKDKELFRMGCSDKSLVWESELATDIPLPDDCLIDEMDVFKNQLWAAHNAMRIKAVANIGNIYKIEQNVALWKAVSKVGDARDLLYDGGLEAGWEDLIGTQWEPEVTDQEVFTCQSEMDQAFAQLNALNQQLAQCQATYGMDCLSILSVINVVQNQIASLQNSPTCWETIQVTTYVPVDDAGAANDGLFREAEMTTGAPGVPTYQNKEVNHMEVLNHPEMWNNFLDFCSKYIVTSSLTFRDKNPRYKGGILVFKTPHHATHSPVAYCC